MSMEQWDAYTKDGTLTGQTLIRGERIPDGLYHLVCEVIVQHTDGSILCMKRSRHKPNYPGYYEATAGGSALKGEDKLACVMRELREETGIVCESFREIGFYVDERDQTIYCSYACTAAWDKTAVSLQEGETEAFVWMEEAEFSAFLRSGRMIERQKKRFLAYYREMGWL